MDSKVQPSKIKPLETITARALQGMDFPPLRWIVDDILPEGLAMLLAPPKYGKSWFAQQLCFSVATGTPFLGNNTTKGTVLYLALESSQRQLQDRQLAFCSDDETAPADFHMATTAERLDSGIIDQLRQFVQQHEETILIVIDLLAKIRPAERVGVNVYYHDYAVMAPLKALADELHICVLVLHHSRKIVDENDFLNNASGSNGLTGSVDTYIGIQRDRRDDSNSTFYVTGRDVEMQSFKAEFDPDTCLWQRTETAMAQTKDPLFEAIETLLRDKTEWSGTMTELVNITGYTVKGQDPVKTAGRRVKKLNNQLLRAGIRYEKVRGNERKYRFWKEEQ